MHPHWLVAQCISARGRAARTSAMWVPPGHARALSPPRTSLTAGPGRHKKTRHSQFPVHCEDIPWPTPNLGEHTSALHQPFLAAPTHSPAASFPGPLLTRRFHFLREGQHLPRWPVHLPPQVQEGLEHGQLPHVICRREGTGQSVFADTGSFRVGRLGTRYGRGRTASRQLNRCVLQTRCTAPRRPKSNLLVQVYGAASRPQRQVMPVAS